MYLYIALVGLFSALFFMYVLDPIIQGERQKAYGETNTTALILQQHNNGAYGILMNGYVKYIEVFGTI